VSRTGDANFADRRTLQQHGKVRHCFLFLTFKMSPCSFDTEDPQKRRCSFECLYLLTCHTASTLSYVAILTSGGRCNDIQYFILTYLILFEEKGIRTS